MARYIDADMFEEQLRLNYCKDCNSYNGVRCSSCEIDDALDFIEDAPTADVAPKTEVAREIFEEIEKLIVRCYNDKWYVVPDLWCDVKMLKEKYTEEKT